MSVEKPYTSIATTTETQPPDMNKLAWWKMALFEVESWYHKLLVKQKFNFDGVEMDCFYHRYNRTCMNERMEELPIVWHLINSKPGRLERVMELGNVFVHYDKYRKLMLSAVDRWTVVDKFEKSPGVINDDIMKWEPAELFDCIVAVSTVEHIGTGGDEYMYAKMYHVDNPQVEDWSPVQVMERLKGMLATGGRLIVTWSPGYNLVWDDAFRARKLGCTAYFWMRLPRPCFIAVYDDSVKEA